MSLMNRALGMLGMGRPKVAVGGRAPDFTLQDSDHRSVALRDLLARGPVVLAFFPKAFTTGCTRELRAYRDQHGALADRGAQLVAISMDDPDTLARFRATLNAPFIFLSDPEGSVSRRYGGVSAGTSNRITVTVASDGLVSRVTTGLAAIFPRGDIEACPVAPPSG